MLFVQPALLEHVDVWAETDGGDVVAVMVLSQFHMMELSPSKPQGWVCAVCNALHKSLPKFAVLPANIDPVDTSWTDAQLKSQLNL
jgi:hypothetical protein